KGTRREAPDRSTLTPTGNLVVSVFLGFIGTFGLVNNLLVLVLFCRYKMLRSPINLLLMNISISDLLVCVLGTPFSFAASTQGRWLIGEAGCVWYGFANSLFGVVSLISLAVLSFERYSTMMTPTEADPSNYCKVCLGITLSWVYSLVWTSRRQNLLFLWSMRPGLGLELLTSQYNINTIKRTHSPSATTGRIDNVNTKWILAPRTLAAGTCSAFDIASYEILSRPQLDDRVNTV
ncbi:hypothetical protein fugu_014255, partial [Takifugu bimaculatus]